MLLHRLQIKNFRGIRDASLEFGRLTALVGRNGAGKSSILKAIEVFFDPAASLSREDFHANNTDTPIEIVAEFAELRPAELEEFTKYVDADRLRVVKRVSWSDDRSVSVYVGSTRRVPELADVQALGTFKERQAAFKTLAESEALAGLRGTIKSGAQLDQVIAEYEDEHPELLQPTPSSFQFFGARNVGGGKLGKYTSLVPVPAVRDAQDETSARRDSSLQTLLQLIALRQIDARQDVRELRTEMNERAKAVYSTDNLVELGAMAADISEGLMVWAPGSEFRLSWDEFEVPDIPLPRARPTLVEDGFESGIERKGHGLQRALIMTLLHYLAKAPDEPEVEQDDDATAPRTSPDLILTIEEPELYLHPSRCRHLASVLSELAEGNAQTADPQNQIIYTTHSPLLVDITRYDEVRVVRKIGGATEIASLSAESVAERVSKIGGREIEAKAFLAKASGIMTSIANEGFFAEKVVVIEGASDAAALWAVSRQTDAGWIEKGIATVPALGKRNLDRPTEIFRGLGIPTYFVFDGDDHHAGKNEARADSARNNKMCLRLGAAAEVDFPETSVRETFAVFNDEIETEISKAIGDAEFESLRSAVARELGNPRSSEVLKSPVGMEMMIDRIYAAGLTIPVLEEIVQAVGRMD